MVMHGMVCFAKLNGIITVGKLRWSQRILTAPQVVARASCFTQRYITRLQAEPHNYSLFRKILVGLVLWRPFLTYAQEV